MLIFELYMNVSSVACAPALARLFNFVYILFCRGVGVGVGAGDSGIYIGRIFLQGAAASRVLAFSLRFALGALPCDPLLYF